jgi:TATA-box binding protein (TBP) (component of TFIID and TFIIIB)
MTAVIFRLEQPLKKVMVYRTGKLLFWGAKTIEDMELAFQLMRKEMLAYELVLKGERSDTTDHEL